MEAICSKKACEESTPSALALGVSFVERWKLALSEGGLSPSLRSTDFQRNRTRMAVEAPNSGIVLLRKRPYAATQDGKENIGIQQTQKQFLRKTKQGRVLKGER